VANALQLSRFASRNFGPSAAVLFDTMKKSQASIERKALPPP
jgi:hypothetical protein